MAPDFPTLYKFEENLEDGFAVVLTGLADNIYTQRQTVIKLTPWLEIKVSPGAATGHRSNDNAGVFRYDIFAFTLGLTFVTTRSENFAAHNVMLSKVRAALGDVKNNVNFDGSNFPYYWICLLRDQSTEPGFHADDDYDQSHVSYTGVFAIKNDSWPAS